MEWRLIHRQKMSRHRAKTCVEAWLEWIADCDGKNPSKFIDEAWHVAVLHTDEYRAFCLENFGKFVEHLPTWPPPKRFFDSSKAECGPAPWNMAKDTSGDHDCGASYCASCGTCKNSGVKLLSHA